MGCTSCSSDGGTPRGCKNNGTCSSGGCNKLGVFDWLSNMDLPNGKSQYDIVEIRFKNSRKGFYRNVKGLSLVVGDIVVVESSPGYDVGVVSIVGELARIQVQKKAPNLKPHEARGITRIVNQNDVDKWVEARNKEQKTMHEAREMAIRLNLEMKISDVEFQGDGTKATFYYTADERVDFRQLIKEMADAFKVRIEMRQIGARQESARLGGIGSCGRELCCSTWLTDFRTVSTSAARYQQLSLNPQKLAGQCGKLKCCLNYELDSYLDVLKDFPRTDVKLYTEKGTAFHVKTDVFKGLLWYLYDTGEASGNTLIPLTPDRVSEIIALNKEKKKPVDLKDFVQVVEQPASVDYTNVVGQEDLSRFDNVFKKKKKKRKPQSQRNQGGTKGKQTNRQPKSNAKGQQNTSTSNTKKQDNRPQKRKRPPQQRNKGKSNPSNDTKKD